MKRYALTGAPGSGKTSILRHLASRGYATVPEAATDVIAESQARGCQQPWNEAGFVDEIVAMQRRRQRASVCGFDVQIFDRSPVCTLALARYLGRPVPAVLADEVDRIVRARVYESRVLLVRPIGFCEPTAARRISYQDSLVFEQVHREVYRSLGYQLVEIPPGGVIARANEIVALLSWARLPS